MQKQTSFGCDILVSPQAEAKQGPTWLVQTGDHAPRGNSQIYRIGLIPWARTPEEVERVLGGGGECRCSPPSIHRGQPHRLRGECRNIVGRDVIDMHEA